MRVLIVDDDEFVRLSIAEFLADEGHFVEKVESVDAALTKIATEPYGALVTDLNLGTTLDGVDVIDAFLARGPLNRALLMSGNYDTACRRAGGREAVLVVQKPFSMVRITDWLDAVA